MLHANETVVTSGRLGLLLVCAFAIIPGNYSHALGESLKDIENREKQFDLMPACMVEKFELLQPILAQFQKTDKIVK